MKTETEKNDRCKNKSNFQFKSLIDLKNIFFKTARLCVRASCIVMIDEIYILIYFGFDFSVGLNVRASRQH